jgi:3-isopropylmalate/(R)-2-methylmalate dehydratase small subunit
MNDDMRTLINGQVRLLRRNGKAIDDIDTDMIYHNAHLAITDVDEMGQYALGNLEGFEDFAKKAREGDIIVAGKNFGAGSSRQQAVECFRSLGVVAVIADSFGAIYKRNAINTGFPVIEAPGLCERDDIADNDGVEIDLAAGTITIPLTESVIDLTPWSKVQMDIFKAGGLFAYGRTLR